MCVCTGGSLTQAGLMIGIHIQVFAPLHHALEDGHEALQAFLPETELLKDKGDKYRDSTKCRCLEGSGSPVTIQDNH